MIVLPKCPFCVMAYSSAITMCGGPSMYLSGNNWVSYIPLLLGVVIISMILLNRRGIRTYYALLIGAIGFLMILLTHQLVIESVFYN